ncbi:MAG: TetR/AcrR family transcriptional regulator [Opitutaceae bacterium]|jgi:AcrR family transcriptional regulator|nr:TetR/AcrR family transcriptional regulator [Opitutaceae bacterium]
MNPKSPENPDTGALRAARLSRRDARLSRRERPAKAPLSVDAIVAAALDLMAREGLDGLSLRKVAAALDTGPASLYVYVENLNALLALMFDRALGKVVIPPASKGGWRERLSAILFSCLKVLMSMPGLGQLALTTAPTGPNSLRMLEAILALLREGGADDARAAWGVDSLLLQFAAIAAEQDAHHHRAVSFGTMEQVIENIPAETYPNIHALRKKLLEGTPRERVRWTIDVMINGVLNTPRT